MFKEMRGLMTPGCSWSLQRLAGLLAGFALMLASPAAPALGFGELLAQSLLNRPLDVVFPVILDPGGDPAQLPAVSVAGDTTYTALGVRRPDLLDSVRITLEPAGAQVLVHVRTEQRVLEPYIPLIVQVAMPSGVLRHRYDLLLDPATSETEYAPAQPIAAPAEITPIIPATVAAATAQPVQSADSPPAPGTHKASSHSHQFAATVVPVIPACIAPSAVAAAPPSSPALFQLDSGLHTPLPRAIELPPAPPPSSAVPPPPADSAAQAPPAMAPPPPAKAAVPAPPAATPAVEPARGFPWLDLFIVILLIGGGYVWYTGKFQALLPGRRHSAGEADSFPQRYVSMAEIHAGSGSPAAAATPAATPDVPRTEAHRPDGSAATPGADGIEYIPFVASPPGAAPPPPSRERSRHEGIEVIDASGFYDDIALLLEQTLEREPRRLDLYQKLIEVYIAAGKPQQGQRIRQQLETLRSTPGAAGIDNNEWQRVLQQTEELLSRESVAGPPVVGIESAAASTRWSRYYEGAEFESLGEHLAPVREAYAAFRRDPILQQTFIDLINEEIGRPTPLQPALQFSTSLGGAQIYFKREDLRPAGSERVVNLIGQMLLMRSMGKLGIVTAAATVRGARAVVSAAKVLEMPSTVFMPPDRIKALEPVLLEVAQKHHVEFVPAADLRDLRRDALSCWLENPDRLGYITGLRAGPDPFPTIVMDFVAVVGHETRRQMLRYSKRDPAAIVGSALGGFAAIGFVKPYLEKSEVRIVLTDPPAGLLTNAPAAAPQGASGYELALREQRWLHASGRVEYLEVEAERARVARLDCDRVEEFMPKPGDAAAIGMGLEIAAALTPAESVVILLSAFGP